jgi:hypothetical protein
MPQSLRTGGVIRRDEAPMFGEHLDGCVVPLEFMARLEQPEIDMVDAAFEWGQFMDMSTPPSSSLSWTPTLRQPKACRHERPDPRSMGDGSRRLRLRGAVLA